MATRITEKKLVDAATNWWQETFFASTNQRVERARDEDYYDGIQWTDSEVQELQLRGQAPLVFNIIGPVINWLVGTERRTRIDFRVLPRSNDKDQAKIGLAKTNLIKYIYADNYVRMENSLAFKDGAISGEGWVEVCLSEYDDESPVKVRYEDWRNIWYDRNSRSYTLDDARYLFRSKYVDLDVAVDRYPRKAEALRAAAIKQSAVFSSADPTAQVLTDYTYGFVDSRREFVRLIEGWFRFPGEWKRVDGGVFDGYFVDQIPSTLLPILEDEIDAGEADIISVRTMRVFRAMFVASGETLQPHLTLLDYGPSPYRHNRFPFVPFFCYKRRRDRAPYGVVRNAVGPQDDLNKRRSKALHILSTAKVIADSDAFTANGWANAEDEFARPDAIIKLDGRRGARFDLVTDNSVADSHISLMHEDKDAIFITTGVNNESIGTGSPYTSGKAVLARQDKSTVVTTEVFDNYRLFLQLEGELILSLAEQAYVDEDVVRVRNDDGTWHYMEINAETPDGDVINDISGTKHDFVISEVDYRDSLRQAMFEQLMDTMSKMPPDIAMSMLDIVIEMSDLPNKDLLAERIRAITGQTPPKDDATPVDEEKARAMEEAKLAREQEQAAASEADRKLKEAEAERKLADAEWKQKKAELTDAQIKRHIVDAAEKLGITRST